VRAVRETESLLVEFEEQIQQITLIPSTNGVFEVRVGGNLVFSKTRLGRFPQPGELVRKVGEQIRGDHA
jgi:selenoprotein W-related protein